MDPRFIPTGADLDALAKIQEDTVRNLARRYTAQGYEISPEQVDLLIRTIQGEAANEPAAGQHAVGNTMLNRMVDGEKFDRLAAAYDANGLRYVKTEGRSGVPANAGFRKTAPGSMDYNEGIEALMRPQSRFSRFTNLMPDSVKSAKQYYNPREASPSWGGDNFIPLGNHVFGNEFQRTSEATLRDRQQSPIFGAAGDVSIDPTQYADDTLNPFDYEPEFQTPAPEEEQSSDWRASYAAPDENPLFAGLPGKEGNPPGSWQDIFSKLGAAGGKQFKSASLGPDATPKGPSSYVIPGEIYRPSPVRPKRKPYRPRKTRFADIMEGVSGPYG